MIINKKTASLAQFTLTQLSQRGDKIKSMTKAANPAEKRDFFRVNQDVLFDYKVVDAFAAENDSADDEFADNLAMTLVNELRRLDRDSAQTLGLLTEKNRLLGDYLQTLNNKIDLLTKHVLLAQDENPGSTSKHSAAKPNEAHKPKTRINLSEDGLAFICERAIYRDSYIAVRLVFLPSYSPVVSFAKVLRCDQKEERYQVAARFFRLSEQDRQALSRQILKAQVSKTKNAGG